VEGNSSPDLKHSKQKPLEPPCFSPLAPHNGTAFPRSARADPGRASVTRRCDTIHARTRSPGRLKNKIKPPRKTQRSRRQGERPPVFVPSLPHSPHSPLDPPPAAPLRIRRSSRAEIGSSRILLVSYPFRRLVEVGGLLSSFLEPVLVSRRNPNPPLLRLVFSDAGFAYRAVVFRSQNSVSWSGACFVFCFSSRRWRSGCSRRL
jgi:hypothetical protein